MILLLDTSTPVCKLTFIDDNDRYEKEWEAGRELAKGLLGFLLTELESKDKTWQDLTGIGVFQGPGSFTGLRIGMTVLNTSANSLAIPIVGSTDDDWQQDALHRLQDGENDKLVLPYYGSAANITKPRK
jgi:tRNA threonylcarbamoyladenosine biosynthesis protein TsaB